jgi:O-antigen/teichoic acid export membrane protein
MRSTAAARFLGSRILRQAAVFTASSVLTSAVGMVAKALLARSMSPHEFGAFSFAVSFLMFVGLFFDFGVFLPAARLAALGGPDERRQVVGSALLLFVPVGLACSLGVFALSFGVDSWFHIEDGGALRIVAPLAFVYAFTQVSLPLSQGLDRLNAWSVSGVVGQLLFLGAIAAVVAWGAVGVPLLLVLRAGGLLVGSGVLVAWLRPSFREPVRHARRLAGDARSYGFQVYVGRMLSIGTYQMDVLMLAAYTDATSVGFYALAGAVSYALGLPVLGMATALFPQLAGATELRRRWILISTAVGATALLGALVLARPVITFVFSDRYAAAAALVGPLVAAEAVRGVTSVYNSYLSAQGRGRELRNAALVLTCSNVVLNIALIPPFGAMGAAWASLLALVANLLAHVVVYERSQRRAAAASSSVPAVR